MELYRDEQWLRYNFEILGKSAEELAQIAQCQISTIYNWLNIFRVNLSRQNHVNLVPQLVEFIQGELLGDGHLDLTPLGHSAMVRHTSKHREYVEWL